jgi:hypothetical protein
MLAHDSCVYLTPAPRMSCWCRGFLLIWIYDLALLLLACWWCLVNSGGWGMGETALAVHLFLVFLSCSWSLLAYPAAGRWMKIMARVLGCEKLICDQPLLPWSTAEPGMCWWLLSCCMCVLHAHMLCVQPVCVSVPSLGLGPFGGSARLIFENILSLLIFLLICQVVIPLGITSSLLCCVQGIKMMIKWRSSCSLGIPFEL